MALDVYKDWLGIPDGPRPPGHYELLRVVQFEDDAEKIRSHYRKLNAHAWNVLQPLRDDGAVGGKPSGDSELGDVPRCNRWILLARGLWREARGAASRRSGTGASWCRTLPAE